MGNIYPSATPISLNINKGQFSSSDPAFIPRNAMASAINVQLSEMGYPSKCLGQQRYNATAIGAKSIVSGVGFTAEDGINYVVVASNSGLWYDTGTGTFAAIKYKNDNVAVTINTTNYFYNFQEFWQVSSGTQKKIVFCITNAYPIATNAVGTHNQQSTASRSLMLYVDSGVVYAKNIFYDSSPAKDTMYGASYSGWTTGTQSPTVASDTTTGHAVSASGGVMMTVAGATAAGFSDIYKAYSSFNGTDKTIGLSIYCDTVTNVDYVYLTVQSATNYWSRFTFPAANLIATGIANMTFDLTGTPAAIGTSGACDLTAIVKITIGVHTTNLQALNYTFSQMVLSASGSDDQAVGLASNNPPDSSWPEQGRFICRIYDKILIANYGGATNGYVVSQARNGLNWTNPSGAIDVGGGTINEPYTAAYAFNTSVLLWTRNTLTNVNATPGDLSTWREQQITTTLGNVGNSVCMNNDGWVYYMSPLGIARTDGRVAERVDLDIQDQTNFLAQLGGNAYSLNLFQSTDWKVGVKPGNVTWSPIDTSGAMLKLAVMNKESDWLAGSQSITYSNPNGDCDLVTNPNAVSIGTGVTPANNGTNYALNAPATMSVSQSSDPASYANDGIHQLHIYPPFPPILGIGWWSCDLGNSMNIGVITFNLSYIPSGSGSPVENAYVQYSTDNANWTTIGPVGGNGNQFITLSTPVTARYLRVYWFNITNCSFVGLANFQAYTRYYSSASIVTEQIDYGTTPTTFGDLVAQVAVPVGTTMTFYAITTGGPVYLAAVPPGTFGNYSVPISAPLNEYLKIECTMTADPTFMLTPILYSIAVGGQWISKNYDLGSVPSAWGEFNTVVDNSQISFEISGDNGSHWYTVSSGAGPSIALSETVQFRVTLTPVNYSSLPDIQSIELDYYKGNTPNILPSVFCFEDKIYVSYMKNNSTLGVNDSCFVGETAPHSLLDWEVSKISGAVYPMWSMRDFMQAAYFWVYNEKLMCGDSTTGYVNYLETGQVSCAFIIDDFDRPDSNTSMGNCTTGQTWAVGDIGGAGDTDVFGLSEQQAYCVNANVFNHARYATLPSTLADCNLVCSFPVMNNNQGLIFRWVDDNNYLALWVGPSLADPAKHEYFFRNVVSGTVTDSPAMPSPLSVGLAAEGDEVRIKGLGTAIDIFINRVHLYSTTVTNTTGTKHGLYLAGVGSISSRWENLSINYHNIPSVNYTASITTCGIVGEDTDILLRFIYLYYSSDSKFNLYYRVRQNQDDWSAWSEPMVISPSINISRIKESIPGIVAGMAIQLKLEQPLADSVWEIAKIQTYVMPRSVGR
jgi:hypothetical protein